MSNPGLQGGNAATQDRHATPEKFVSYYAQASANEKALERSRSIMNAVLRTRRRQGAALTGLEIGDVGCNAGTQSLVWARNGHSVHGIDISSELVALARQRAEEQGLEVEFCVGDAVRLPWDSASLDVCLMPELLEHVPEWAPCLDECARVLKPGGTLYLTTTNRLCPKQQEFELPLYSWYPSALKRRYERLAVTTRPELVSHAKYPAVHWFTFYQLRDALNTRGLDAADRFDILDSAAKPALARLAIYALRHSTTLRLIGHILTPYTVVMGTKRSSM